MNTRTTPVPRTLSSRALRASLSLTLILCAAAFARAQGPSPAAQTPARAHAHTTPAETVRAFYKALGERRFREAFAMSIFHPAIEGLTPEEFEELRPDFERMASGVPAEIVLTGEQVSGDEATVFMKLGEGAQLKVEPVTLIRERGAWVIGDREKREFVRKRGKRFFLEARIETHEAEVEDMLKRIVAAQLFYATQHNGVYGDLPALVGTGLIPRDILGTDSTGYRFQVTLGGGGKTYAAHAEPARYGRTGRLSFYMDANGIQKKDTGGKPLKGSK
jgi:hypothetical protein